MARNDNSAGDPGNETPHAEPSASEIVEDLLAGLPATDAKYRHLLLLRHRLDTEARGRRDMEDALQRYSEAYEKLTAPANRIATFLGSVPGEETVLIGVGDQEYVAVVDPKAELPALAPGDRVRVNDAFAVVGVVSVDPVGPLAKVSEVISGNRLRIGGDAQGSGGRIVVLSEALRDAGVAVGDEVRVDAGMRLAVEHFRKDEAKDFFLEEVPEIPWSRVGGQEEAIGVIRDAIELPLLHPELYARFGKRPLKGILLYGPPGCGKTLIGKATAYNLTREYNERTGESLKEYFLYINGPKILNMWLGESERQVREIFATARSKAKDGHLVFLFIDEAESILRTRNSGRFTNISNTVVPQFCAEMDGLVSCRNVVVMLTSNRPDYIDPAILRPERIDRRVRVRRPDRDAARAILSIYLDAHVPYSPEELALHDGDSAATAAALADSTVEYLWRTDADTEFLDVFLRNGGSDRLYWKDLVSGALLSSLVDRAKDFAIKRAIATKRFDEGVSRTDLERAAAAEYKENEIFPKSDQVEDWLLLLDHAPENVADVKPIRPATRGKGTAKPTTGVI